MGALSELSDGYEPHGQIQHRGQHARYVYSGDHGGGVYPGWCSRWVHGRVLYRVLNQGPARGQIEAYLRNYIEYGFIRPFD